MKQKRSFLCWVAAALCTALVVCQLPLSGVYAENRIDTSKKANLSLTYTVNGGQLVVANVQVKLYQVSKMGSDGSFNLQSNLVAPFDKMNVNIGQNEADPILTQDAWKEAAASLKGWTLDPKQHINPLKTAKSDANGKVTFTDLALGLYYIIPDTSSAVLTDGTQFTFAPSFICLPDLEEQTGSSTTSWNYDVQAAPKGTSSTPGHNNPTPPTPSYDSSSTPSHAGGNVTYKINKLWNDTAAPAGKRPKSITVDLLHLVNGKVTEIISQVLSDANNWTYSWSTAADNSEWTVAEVKIDGYVTLSQAPYTVLSTINNSYTITLTNNYKGSSSTPPSHGNGSTPTPKPGSVPPSNHHTPSTPTTVSTPTRNNQPRLPQTGQLWWPVPFLAVAGLVLFSAGWVLNLRDRKRYEDENE